MIFSFRSMFTEILFLPLPSLCSFRGIKAANWNKNRAKCCKTLHLYYNVAWPECWTFVFCFHCPFTLLQNGRFFYVNIIEQSDQTSPAQTIVIMTSQLCHLRCNFQTIGGYFVQFKKITPIEVRFAPNAISWSIHSADCFEIGQKRVKYKLLFTVHTTTNAM